MCARTGGRESTLGISMRLWSASTGERRTDECDWAAALIRSKRPVDSGISKPVAFLAAVEQRDHIAEYNGSGPYIGSLTSSTGRFFMFGWSMCS
jgi:hypothetical protein